jgi:hypothetical protein
MHPTQASSAQGDFPVEISIVTPMHNEELCVREFHRRMSAVLRGMGVSHESSW